ncbi:MAG: phosphoglycolate phosphatase [Brachymonas sp.]|nr:phosphoglycolate phosphatase [Brachymonas sp.]
MTTTMSIEAVLFDLDGTLVDSAPDLGAAVDQMRTARGLPSLPQAAYRQAASAGARGLLAAAFNMQPDDADYAAYRDEFLANYAQCLFQQTLPFAGIADLLQALPQRGLLWGIVTNKPARFAEPLVEGLSDLRPAAVVISGDTLPQAKPHPEPLLEAARRMAVAPQHCLYVGDDLRDIQAAHAAGMVGMAALWGYLGGADVATWGADVQVQQPAEVLVWLEQQTRRA